MDVVVARCAGLDVHKDTVVACLRTPGPDGGRWSEVRTFGTFTVELLALRDWLVANRVTLVGMESTGVYWKPVFYLLEEATECWLLNAQHMRNVPGRKTDVADAAWIAQLIEHGLVRPSFVPPPPIRELRSLTRYRKTQIEERTREVQRLDKVLQDAGSSSLPWPATCWASPGGTCSTPWWPAPATPSCSPSWPGAGSGARSLR